MATMDSEFNRTYSESSHPSMELLSTSQLLVELKRERSRADRRGDSFSVVFFPQRTRSVRAGNQLRQLLVSRLRQSDKIGWFNEGVIGVVLTATDNQGARRYLFDLWERYPELREHFCPTIQSYPRVGILRQEDTQESFSYADRYLEAALAPPVPRWKRGLDIVGASFGIFLFSPLFLLFPVYLKLVSPGPVFYKQERVGFRGRSFVFLKFRSMHVDNPATAHKDHLRSLIKGDAPMAKLDDKRDPRIIPGGRFLRGTALDEVPQFINVLKGEMSLVGPRPCIPYEAEEYLRWHAHRFDVVPGMSGLWQVSGKNRLSFKEMIRLDIAYSRQMSLWLDIKIIALTFPSIVREAYLKVLDRRGHKSQEESV